MFRRLRARFTKRCRVRGCSMRGRHEHCETCAVATRKPHEVTETLTDLVDGYGSGTAMTALFCARDCPGGCQYDHDRKAALT